MTQKVLRLSLGRGERLFLKQCVGSSSLKALSKSLEVLVISKCEEAGTTISATKYPMGQPASQRELGKETASKSSAGVRTHPRH